MNFRLAVRRDCEALSALACANPFSAQWSEADFASEISQPCSKVFVLENKKEIIAFVCFRCVPPSAELLNFAVGNKFLRQGLGSALLYDAIEDLSVCGVKEITLEVSVQNAAAAALYKKFSFQTVSLRKKFYNNKIDAALMRLTL